MIRFNKNIFTVYDLTFIGFSLAEVLITLGIIGIIAALMIPVLIASIDETSTSSAFLKQASILEQVTKKYLSDNSLSYFNNVFNGRADMANKFLAPYYRTLKYCANVTDVSCLNMQIQMLNSDTTFYTPDVGIVTADGAIITVRNATLNCNTDGVSGRCGEGYIDVNGTKGPNRIGYDTFLWFIYTDRLEFGNSSGHCIKPPNANWNQWYNDGVGCAGRMIQGLPRWQ